MGAPAAMNGLDARQVERLAGELARLKREATAGVRRASGEMSEEDAELFRDAGLTGDGALAEAEFERDVAGAGQVRAALLAIVAAERRLAGGEYGLCEDCGEAIGFARLEAHPAATRCVRCQEALEKRGGPALFAG
ncbi:MAG TPA: TraR/DksA family transcriptional regulator [Usitatibacteraceae bacterium]|jgi:RNA polymerase-binding protein DksA|nr:TraR/DksA family transcriptional regulator [Usitatibacteraceae bacterium]